MDCLFNNTIAKRITAFVSAMLILVLSISITSVNAYADSDVKISLEDLDDCLTDYEETELETEMLKAANKIHCNIGIVITADLDNKISQQYADDYSDRVFGAYTDSIVLVLLNRHGNPEMSNTSLYKDWISTDGNARNLYDKYIDGIFNRLYRGLDKEFFGTEPEHIEDVYESTDSIQFFMAGKYFCKALVSYRNPVSRFFSNALMFALLDPIMTIVVIVITVSITAATVKGTKSKYKNKKPISAAAYHDSSRFRLKREVDRFVREYTTSVSTSSSSSGGGHHSGGGGHHGGGGGRSR